MPGAGAHPARAADGVGDPEGVTHDYVRHGTITLVAALTVANGQVFARCKPRHRHQEFLAFLREVEANVPPALAVHLPGMSTIKRWALPVPLWHRPPKLTQSYADFG